MSGSFFPVTAEIYPSRWTAKFLLEWLTSLATAKKVQTHLQKKSSVCDPFWVEVVDFEQAGIELLGSVMSARSVGIDSDTPDAVPLVLLAQLGFISRQKGKWVLTVPQMVGPDGIIDAYMILNKARQPDGVQKPERFPPFSGSLSFEKKSAKRLLKSGKSEKTS